MRRDMLSAKENEIMYWKQTKENTTLVLVQFNSNHANGMFSRLTSYSKQPSFLSKKNYPDRV